MSLIKLKDVKKDYVTGEVVTKVLKGLTFEIDEGEFVAIMGPSGSGKSTLMNIMGFLDVPTSGDYFFENQKVTAFDENSLADIRNQKVGFVFQSFQLLPRMTAMENVRLPMIYAKVPDHEQISRAEKMLKSVGLGHRLNNRPNELSGGEQQRVAIARALVNNPRILFADEPTGNLDSKVSSEIMSIIKELHQEKNTIVMITHDRRVAKQAERIISLKDGAIVKE